MSRKREEIFPIKLNDEHRYGICLRIAIAFQNKQIQEWLQQAYDIKVTYAGIQKYRTRKRWAKLTDSLRNNIIDNPKAKQLIYEVVRGWLDAESDKFMKLGESFRDDLRKLRIQDPQLAEQYRSASYFLVTEFNKVLNRVTALKNELGIKRGLN